MRFGGLLKKKKAECNVIPFFGLDYLVYIYIYILYAKLYVLPKAKINELYYYCLSILNKLDRGTITIAWAYLIEELLL